jgi:hypothetical protein
MLPSSLELNFNKSADVLIGRIRQLSKTNYWQTVYGSTKELGFQLFENRTNFSELQLLFLNYMGFYSVINMDIALGDVTDIVLENEIYEDAYIHYKNKSDKKKIADRQTAPQQSSLKNESQPKVNWVFKKPKKA